MIHFEWYDAWVLAGITLVSNHNEGIDLEGLISATDYINHAIITHAELDSSLFRLITAGYVENVGNHFRMSPQVIEYFKKNIEGTRPGLRPDKFKLFLKAEPWNSGYVPEKKGAGAVIPYSEYEKGVEAYHAKMQSILKKL